ncbi:MAG: hypothetical protein H7Z38_16250 [Rubrivivax sp.]|nr:hypothetical protein [Pyrinomonadaceae bacterium]
MPKSSTTKSAKKRVKVKNLPAGEKTLTEKEAKKVKGGTTTKAEVFLPSEFIVSPSVKGGGGSK